MGMDDVEEFIKYCRKELYRKSNDLDKSISEIKNRIKGRVNPDLNAVFELIDKLSDRELNLAYAISCALGESDDIHDYEKLKAQVLAIYLNPRRGKNRFPKIQYQYAIDKYTNFEPAYYTYACDLIKKKEYNYANIIIGKMLKECKIQNDQISPKAHTLYAIFYKSLNTAKDEKCKDIFQEVEKHLKDAVSINNEISKNEKCIYVYPLAYFIYATFLKDNGRKLEAKKVFETAIRFNDKCPLTRLYYAVFLEDYCICSKDDDEVKICKNKAKYNFEKAIDLDLAKEKLVGEINPKIYFMYATFLTDICGEHNDAQKKFIKAIEVDPTSMMARFKYAVCLRDCGRKLKSKEVHNKSPNCIPGNTFSSARSECCVYRSIKCFKDAIDFDNDDPLVHILYANLLKDIDGMDIETEEQFKQAICLDRDNIAALSYYAVFLNDHGRNEEAEKQFEAAIARNPNNAILLSTYANFLSKTAQEIKENIQYYKVNEKYFQTYIGDCEKRLKDYEDKARYNYMKALKIKPNNAIIRYSYALFLSQCYELHSEACREVEKARLQEPSNPYVLWAYGEILANENYYKESIDWYKRALKNPIQLHSITKSAIYNNLGWSYYKLAKSSTVFKLPRYWCAGRSFNKAKKEDMYNIKAVRNHRAFKENTYLELIPKYLYLKIFVSLILVSAITAYLLYDKGVPDTRSKLIIVLLFFITLFIIFYVYSDKVKSISLAGVGVDFELEKNNMLSNERTEKPFEILEPRSFVWFVEPWHSPLSSEE